VNSMADILLAFLESEIRLPQTEKIIFGGAFSWPVLNAIPLRSIRLP